MNCVSVDLSAIELELERLINLARDGGKSLYLDTEMNDHWTLLNRRPLKTLGEAILCIKHAALGKYPRMAQWKATSVRLHPDSCSLPGITISMECIDNVGDGWGI